MGEEVKMNDIEEVDDNEERVIEWEDGLPDADDLIPLSQNLISQELASAFNLETQPSRSIIDVNRASQETLSSICRMNHRFHLHPLCSSNNLKLFPCLDEDRGLMVERDDYHEPGTPSKDGSESRKIRKIETNDEETELSLHIENSCNDEQSTRTSKRPRLVWTPQLHKRFVDVVAHLGIKNAVPKTIMQMMNVDGLTRENVASHLQKYRLYLKRMSNEGPSSKDDHLFASTPVPKSLRESTTGGGSGNIPPPSLPLPTSPPPSYAGVPFFPMPILGMGHGHMGMSSGNLSNATYSSALNFHPYNMLMRDNQRDWSSNKFGPMLSYSRATNGEK